MARFITLHSLYEKIEEFKHTVLNRVFRVIARPIDLVEQHELVRETPVSTGQVGHWHSTSPAPGLYVSAGEIDPSYYGEEERYISAAKILDIYEHGLLLKIPSEGSRMDLMNMIAEYVATWISIYRLTGRRELVPVDDLMLMNRFCDALAATIYETSYSYNDKIAEMLRSFSLSYRDGEDEFVNYNKIDRREESAQVRKELARIRVKDPVERFRIS